MFAVIKLEGNKVKRCAFCKYWYDPTNSHIKPQDTKHGYWKFDPNARCMYLKKNITIGAGMRCDYFDCKV